MKANLCPTLPTTRLEQYLMGLLPAQIAARIYDDSIAQIEDHLLICSTCLTEAETHEFLMLGLRAERAQTQSTLRAAGRPLPFAPASLE